MGVCFRTNVGQAWTGDRIERHPDGSITIYKARPFKSGLPEGFTDLLIVQPMNITREMVGKKIALASFLEVKSETGKPTKAQLNFIDQMRQLGAKAGVARSVDAGLKILRSG